MKACLGDWLNGVGHSLVEEDKHLRMLVMRNLDNANIVCAMIHEHFVDIDRLCYGGFNICRNYTCVGYHNFIRLFYASF